MKYASLSALTLVAVVFLMTATSGAEQEDVKAAMVTKFYDLSAFFRTPVGFPGPNIDITDRDDDHGLTDGAMDPEHAADLIRDLAGWPDENKDELAQFTYGYRFLVRVTPAKIRDFDRAIETLFPKPWSHNLTVALAVKEGGDAPPAVDAGLAMKDGLAFLKGQGFSCKWFTQVTLCAGRVTRLFNGNTVSYVSDQEGLIATFARGFDPVVKMAGFGASVHLKYRDFENVTTLDLVVQEARLKEMKSSIQNGNEIQLPVIAYNDWRRQIVFSRPGTQTIGYLFDGTACVLLIELED
ncbi:MAG: hypothetical protein WC712_02855 [Candidatus Brocadiia bacterium]